MATKKSAKKKAPVKVKAKAKPAAAKATPKAPSKAKAAPGTRAAAKSQAKKPASPKRAEPESLRLRSVSPSFTVNDLAASLAWYRDVMGFTVGTRYEHEGKLMGVELYAGDAFFMLGQDDWKKGKDRIKGEGMRLYCMTVQDVDVLAAEIQARGGKLGHAPMDQSWGMRDFSVTDPDGFKITIARELEK